MIRILMYALALCLGSVAQAYEPLCVQPQQLARTSVRLSAEFTLNDEHGYPYTVITSGSGWFLNPTHVATVAHVATAFASPYVWTDVEISQTTMGARNTLRTERIPVRVRGVHKTKSREDLVILELERPFIGAQGAYFRDTPLEPGEPVVGIGYPDGVFHVVTGTFLFGREVTYGNNPVVTEYQVDVSAGEDRVVFGVGASGSPIFDCAGHVVLSISHIKQAGLFVTCTDEGRGCKLGETSVIDVPLPKGSGTHLAVPTSGLVHFSSTLTKK